MWWTSHGACRGRSERLFDGCDCFGSRSAFLTSAGPGLLQKKKTAGLVLDTTCWPCLATGWLRVFSSNRSSKAQDRTTPGSRDGQLEGLTFIQKLQIRRSFKKPSTLLKQNCCWRFTPAASRRHVPRRFQILCLTLSRLNILTLRLTLDLWRSAVPDSIGPARSQPYSTSQLSHHCNC